MVALEKELEKIKQNKVIAIGIGVALLVLLLLLLYFAYHRDLQLWFNPEVSKELVLKQIRSHGVAVALLFFCLIGIMCAIPGVPTSVVCVFVGVCYGPVVGSLINVGGNLMGNLVAIALFRRIKLIDKRHGKNEWVKAISRMKHPKVGLTLGYMIPVVPTFLVNYTATLKGYTEREVLLPVLLGVLPTSIFYALGGDALLSGDFRRLLLVAVGLGAILLLVGLLKRHEKREKAK